jgi:hypothetical protein
MANEQPKGKRVPGTNTFDVQQPPPKKKYYPEDELGTGILIDGKQMKPTSKPAPKPDPKPMKKMAKGGVTRADGCVRKGHTKGKMV